MTKIGGWFFILVSRQYCQRTMRCLSLCTHKANDDACCKITIVYFRSIVLHSALVKDLLAIRSLQNLLFLGLR